MVSIIKRSDLWKLGRKPANQRRKVIERRVSYEPRRGRCIYEEQVVVVVDGDSHAVVLRLCLPRFYDDQGNHLRRSLYSRRSPITELRIETFIALREIIRQILFLLLTWEESFPSLIFVLCRKYLCGWKL